MDSFLRLHELYLKTSRWEVITRIYKESPLRMRALMWLEKLVFIAFSVPWLTSASWEIFAALATSTALFWALTFSKARAGVFSELRRLYPERIKHFSRDYQYIRYIEFKKRLESSGFPGSIDDALEFTSSHSDINSQPPITSHPFMLITSGAFLAVLGGGAGRLEWNIIAIILFLLAFLFFFSYIVIDVTRTPTSDLREFKRFLCWIKNDY